MMFEYLFDHVSDNGDGLREGVNDFWSWRDGEYLSWPAYRDERRAASQADAPTPTPASQDNPQ